MTTTKGMALDIAVAQHNGHAAGLQVYKEGIFVAGGVHNQAVHPAREQKRNLIPLFGRVIIAIYKHGHRSRVAQRKASPTPSKTAVENGEDWSETTIPSSSERLFFKLRAMVLGW